MLLFDQLCEEWSRYASKFFTTIARYIVNSKKIYKYQGMDIAVG